MSRDDEEPEFSRPVCRKAVELSLDVNESWLTAESKDADDSDRGKAVLLAIYGLANAFPSSCKKFLRIDFTQVGCQFGYTSLKITYAFNAEISMMLLNTAIGHRFVFLLQL